MNYSSILMNWKLVIYCKTEQFASVNQIQFATVNLNYIKGVLLCSFTKS